MRQRCGVYEPACGNPQFRRLATPFIAAGAHYTHRTPKRKGDVAGNGAYGRRCLCLSRHIRPHSMTMRQTAERDSGIGSSIPVPRNQLPRPANRDPEPPRSSSLLCYPRRHPTPLSSWLSCHHERSEGSVASATPARHRNAFSFALRESEDCMLVSHSEQSEAGALPASVPNNRWPRDNDGEMLRFAQNDKDRGMATEGA